MAAVELAENSVQIEPEAISPNGDGYNDYSTIQFKLVEPEWNLNMRVFDAAGRLIDQPQRNVIIGQEANLNWDGKLGNGQELPAGIYVFYIQLTNLEGKKLVFKKCCTIVTRIM